jgi:inner membrane protein
VPTAPTHAVAALALGAGFYRPGVPKQLLALGAALAALPDLDVLGFHFGIHYGDLLGHRGLTHSLPFAAALAAATVWLTYQRGAGPLGRRATWAFLSLAIASHGLLDMLTDGGLGIALWSPFSNARYFWPCRPIAVAPIGLSGLLGPGMVRVARTEVLWVWCPALAFAVLVAAWRKVRPRPPAVV